MAAYYSEIDPKAAAWLRELIKQGHIAPGDVDERGIEDVKPIELRPYTQCHFYAGIGTWSYALRVAGWDDNRPVWTFSEPCQPFSSAGKGLGNADKRYLRPYTHHLVTHCRPETVFGEQVASKDGLAWLDTLQSDMEGEDYAFVPFDLCAAGFGAPHIRQRLYFVADSREKRCYGQRLHVRPGRSLKDSAEASGGSEISGVDNSIGIRRRTGGIGHNSGNDGIVSGATVKNDRSGPTNGHWRDADWLFCRDGKWRPVEPGTFPLAHGASQRVGRLRGYGNGIVAEQAAEFIQAYRECIE